MVRTTRLMVMRPRMSTAYRRLMDLAVKERKEGETVAQAFARVMRNDKNRDLVAAESASTKPG
jgi:hypothetical protein